MVNSRIFINANITSVREASLLLSVLAVDILGHRSFLNNCKSQLCVVWVLALLLLAGAISPWNFMQQPEPTDVVACSNKVLET